MGAGILAAKGNFLFCSEGAGTGPGRSIPQAHLLTVRKNEQADHLATARYLRKPAYLDSRGRNWDGAWRFHGAQLQTQKRTFKAGIGCSTGYQLALIR
jgi:hypothetical protein